MKSTLVEGPVAQINGQAAFVLSRVLAKGLAGRVSLMKLLEASGASESDKQAALEGALMLQSAGIRWRELQPVSAGGNAATRGKADGLDSQVMVTVPEAAVLLQRSRRRVRQLAAAGDIPAERTSSGWLLSHRGVVGFRDRRQAAQL